MGNIESSDIGSIGSIWDNPADVARDGALYYRDEDSYRDSPYRIQEDDADPSPTRMPVPTAPSSPSPIAKGKETNLPPEETKVAEPAATPPVAPEEITSEAADEVAQAQVRAPSEDPSTTVTHEVNISKSQKTNHVAPEATTTKSADGGTTVVVKKSRMRSSLRDAPFGLLFILHLLLVAAGIVFLNIVFIKDMTQTKLHNLQRWFPQLGAAVLTGGAFAVLCQSLFRFYPFVMARSILWASCILTFGVALMLVSTSMAANLGVGILCLIFSICQSLYACWVSNRIKYAGDLLFHSLNAAKKVRGTYLISMWVLLVALIWLVFWSFGVVSALSFELAPLVVLALLASLAWTLETLRNVVCTATARGVAAFYLDASAHHPHWDRSLLSAFTSWFGSICLGSLIVPILHVHRMLARGLNRIHGDNEFMFSCADCFDKVTHSLTMYANYWAYVQVAVHRKDFVQASKDTFSLFASKRLDIVIERDLTSSFCVLSGISGGMLCALVSGGWTFGTHKALTSSVSVISFFIGYFLVRITMAVPQGAVCAHYVCYGENSASEALQLSPVPDRLKELLADIDTEIAKHA